MARWFQASVTFLLLVPAAAGSVGKAAPELAQLEETVNALYDTSLGAPVSRQLLQTGQGEGPIVVILVLEPSAVGGALRALRALGLDFHLYEHLDIVAVALPPMLLDVVAGLKGVVSVTPNEVMRPYLDKSVPYIGGDVLWKTYNLRGEGIGILVVDSGVDGTHPDVTYGDELVENVVPTPQGVSGLIGGYQEGARMSDPDGHGTHVASIVGGSAQASPQGRFRGVAYQASLVGFQAGITDSDGEVRFESVTVLEAFNYALEKKAAYNLRIVTNSWGTGGEFDPLNPINQATFNLYKGGLVVTFAAGNEGAQGHGTLNKYCVSPWVLCVAAGDYLNRRASFSSMGTDPASSNKPYDHPDIMAPGVGIEAARPVASAGTPVGGLLGGESSYYTTKSGTSMATPHVAGAAALLLGFNRQLSPDQVYDVLVATSTPLPGQPVYESGAGYLNALEAYRAAEDLEGNLAEFMQGKVKYGGKATGDPDYSEDPVSVGLGQGFAKRVTGSDVSPTEFVEQLTTTPFGLVFLFGSVLLAALAFGVGRAKRAGF